MEGVEEVYLVPQLRLQDQTKAITGQEIMGAGKTWEIGYTGDWFAAAIPATCVP